MENKKTKSQKYQLGNFFVLDKGERIEAYDLMKSWKLSVESLTPCGVNIKYLCDNNPDAADIYIKLLWMTCNTIPDEEYLSDLLSAWQKRTDKMPKEVGDTEEREIEALKRMDAFENMSDEEREAELEQINKELDILEEFIDKTDFDKEGKDLSE